jgi:hypothetical protein
MRAAAEMIEWSLIGTGCDRIATRGSERVSVAFGT